MNLQDPRLFPGIAAVVASALVAKLIVQAARSRLDAASQTRLYTLKATPPVLWTLGYVPVAALAYFQPRYGLFVGAVYMAAKAAAHRERLRAAGFPEDYIAAARLAAFVIAAGVAVLGAVAWWSLPA